MAWHLYIDGLVQDCSISSALAMEILQYCTKRLTYETGTFEPEQKGLHFADHICKCISFKENSGILN